MTTATQTFIEKAIEGGWMKGTELQSIAEYDGSYMRYHIFFYDSEGDKWHRDLSSIVLDRDAWMAIGRVMLWPDVMPGGRTCEDPSEVQSRFMQPGWYWNMHRMIDALAEGKTIEEYLQTLFPVETTNP